MENLLSEAELGCAKTAIRTVQETATLQQWVYPMKVISITRGNDKNNDPQLKFVIDSGFKKNNSDEPRLLYKFFHLTGKYKDGRNRIDDLARMLKRCYKQKDITNETLKNCIDKNIAVATTKDDNGYICFWYAVAYSELEKTREIYKFKVSNGVNTTPSTPTAPDQGDLLEGMDTPDESLVSLNDGLDEDGLPF